MDGLKGVVEGREGGGGVSKDAYEVGTAARKKKVRGLKGEGREARTEVLPSLSDEELVLEGVSQHF